MVWLTAWVWFNLTTEFVVRTVAAPPSIVVKCGGDGSSCGRLWCCSCRVVCYVELFLLCDCVWDLFFFLQSVCIVSQLGVFPLGHHQR